MSDRGDSLFHSFINIIAFSTYHPTQRSGFRQSSRSMRVL